MNGGKNCGMEVRMEELKMEDGELREKPELVTGFNGGWKNLGFLGFGSEWERRKKWKELWMENQRREREKRGVREMRWWRWWWLKGGVEEDEWKGFK